MASALVCCRAGPATGLQRKLSTRERQPITAIGPLSPPAAGRHRRRRCRSTPGASRRPVVCTSEHWYEEEDEFDAMTDAMHPKTVVLVAAASGTDVDEAAVQQLRPYLQPLDFAQAFSGEQTMAFARQLWAGRDKTPYFLKVRARPALDACGSSEAGEAAAAAASVWEELLQMNWRVQLDAGLGIAAPVSEALLLVCSPAAAAQLLAAAGSPLNGGAALGSVSALLVDGTQAGDSLDWQRLGKRLALAGAVPSGADTIAAALAQAGAHAVS